MEIECHDDWAKETMKILQHFQQQQLFCNITIHTEDGVLAAHGNVLAAASPVLHEQLSEQVMALQIDSITASVWKLLLTYMYTGKVVIEDHEVAAVLEASHMLRLDHLVAAIETVGTGASLEYTTPDAIETTLAAEGKSVVSDLEETCNLACVKTEETEEIEEVVRYQDVISEQTMLDEVVENLKDVSELTEGTEISMGRSNQDMENSTSREEQEIMENYTNQREKVMEISTPKKERVAMENSTNKTEQEGMEISPNERELTEISTNKKEHVDLMPVKVENDDDLTRHEDSNTDTEDSNTEARKHSRKSPRQQLKVTDDNPYKKMYFSCSSSRRKRTKVEESEVPKKKRKMSPLERKHKKVHVKKISNERGRNPEDKTSLANSSLESRIKSEQNDEEDDEDDELLDENYLPSDESNDSDDQEDDLPLSRSVKSESKGFPQTTKLNDLEEVEELEMEEVEDDDLININQQFRRSVKTEDYEKDLRLLESYGLVRPTTEQEKQERFENRAQHFKQKWRKKAGSTREARSISLEFTATEFNFIDECLEGEECETILDEKIVYKCPLCPRKIFHDKDVLVKHQETCGRVELLRIADQKLSIYRCYDCKSKFRCKKPFVKHLQEARIEGECTPNKTIDENLTLCLDCGKLFFTAHRYELHKDKCKARHRFKVAEFRCKNCRQFLTDIQMALRHSQRKHNCGISTSEQYKQCEVCHRKFSSVRSLQRHRDNKYACVPTPKEEAVDNARWIETKHSCQICEFSSPQTKNLLRHAREGHQATYDDALGPYVRGAVVCQVCKVVLEKPHNYTEHLWFEHAIKSLRKTAYHHCPVSTCSFRSTLTAKYHNHVQMHSEYKTYAYVCSICGQRYTRAATLRKHEATHVTVKPYQCKFCPIRFRRAENLTEHMPTHTRLPPYTCKLCHKTFLRKKQVNKHINLAHGIVKRDVGKVREYTRYDVNYVPPMSNEELAERIAALEQEQTAPEPKTSQEHSQHTLSICKVVKESNAPSDSIKGTQSQGPGIELTDLVIPATVQHESTSIHTDDNFAACPIKSMIDLGAHDSGDGIQINGDEETGVYAVSDVGLLRQYLVEQGRAVTIVLNP